MDEEIMAHALGEETAFGYHIEQVPGFPLALVHDRPASPWYPCLDATGTYSGCLGEACPLEVCWTGGATISYLAALQRRFQPADNEYAAGAPCPRCRRVEQVTTPVIDRRQGLIHLPLLHCGQNRWRHPIGVKALMRRRIPVEEGDDLRACRYFTPAEDWHGAGGTPRTDQASQQED